MIVFENNGVLDTTAITTFGVSVKTNDNPIGYFGTGSKYAIAIFMRLGYELKLVAGGKQYKFEAVDKDFRGKTFGLIHMNDQAMPFTTHLGANWEAWMAFRELHCNAVDEGGDSYWSDDEPEYDSENTYFVLDGSGAEDLWKMKGDIILEEQENHDMLFVNAIEKRSEFLYYRGIRVVKLSGSSQFTYNVKKSITLTEDRTVANINEVDSAIAASIYMSTDKKLIKKMVAPSFNCYERGLSLSSVDYYNPSQEFIEVVTAEFESNNDNLNKSLKQWISRRLESHRHKKIVAMKLSSIEEKMFESSMKIVGKVFPSSKYDIVFCESLGQNTMAFADSKDNTIYISRDCFDNGQLFLASTLLEEHVHLVKGYDDESREMQTYLFDSLTRKIAKEVGVVI